MSVLLNSPAKGKGNAKRALLAEHLRRAAQAAIPLSFAQQRLWFLDQLEPNSPLYNVPTVVRMSGNLNVDALRRALDAIVARHESLRTRFVETDGNPAQVVDPKMHVALEFHDLLAYPPEDREEEVQRLVRLEAKRPFDLKSGPPIRATLIRREVAEHWFILNLHHIVSDEWSLKICFQELAEFYSADREGRTPQLAELPIQFGDYALWQREALTAQILKEQLAYWRERLRGAAPVFELPTDRPRPANQTFRGSLLTRSLPMDLCNNLSSLGAKSGATLFMVTLAAFKALLLRYTQQEDLVVGSPIAGRNRIEAEQLIGFFVNTLLMRTDVSGDPTFEELLRRVRETTLEAYAYGEIPFERVIEELHPERAATHMPFTRIMFALQSDVLEELPWPELKLKFFESDTDTAKFDLTLVLQVTERGLVVRAEYNRDLFEPGSISRLLEHFEVLLKGIVENSRRHLSELPLLNESERRQVVVEWNETKTEYPSQKCIQELFEAQVERRPDKTAIVFENRSLTYQELNDRANRLAHYLKKFSVGSGVLVGICAERSVEMIVGMLAILKAGAAYVPFEGSYPRERLTFMLADASAAVVLTQSRLVSMLPRAVSAVCLDSDWELISRESRTNPPCSGTAESLAYVIYTSGSTGTPKGVAVPHRAVSRLVLNTNYIRLDAEDRVAQISNASFDAATFEVWGALLNGGTLVGITRDVSLSPADFARQLRERKITAMFITTALFNQLTAENPRAFATVRTVMFGGETADPESVARVLKGKPPGHLSNIYGPTENTTFSACYEVRTIGDHTANVPIGRPISNSECYILDRHLNPLPIGVPGELHVGGDGLARGYWNRRQLTAEKFIPNPFRPGEMLYKTGDLTRWLPDGNIEFLGRLDQQVKIRGFRVELEEIEIILGRHPAIRECVVTMRKDKSGHDALAAYFVALRRVPSFDELLRFLKERIPDYMVPSAFVSLDALPLTPNGKVDRKALPEPGESRPLTRRVAAPRDSVELKLTEIWEAVLNVHPVGIEDKFFDLGGHSLLAVKLIAQIEKVFGRRLRVATVFQAPTIEQLSAIIREEIQEGSALAETALVEIQSQGTRPPLFLVHGAGGGMFWGYVNLSRHLGTNQPVYGLKSRGLDGRNEFRSIEEMAADYVGDVRAFQPHGPYHLGGYCFGGNVALEMAHQLTAQGEEVRLLALLNCSPPNSDYDRISWTPAWVLRFARNLLYWVNYVRKWPAAQRREFLHWKKDVLKQRVAHLFDRNSGAPLNVDAGNLVDLSSFPADERELWRTHITSLLSYRAKPYPGRVHLFRSPGHPLICSFAPDYGWGALAVGGVDISIVPGVHEKILEEPCVCALAKELKSRIEKVSPLNPVRISGNGVRKEESKPDVMDSRAVSGESEKRGRAQPPEIKKQQLEYWRQRLNGAPALLDLPADRLRPAHRGDARTTQSFALGDEILGGMEKLARQEDCAPFVVFLAAFQTLLSRYTGATDILVGSKAPVGDQSNPEGMCGKPDNFLPLRCDLAGNPSFREILGRVRQTVRDAQANSVLQFEEILKELDIERNESYAPIFQVMFDYGAHPSEESAETTAFSVSDEIRNQIFKMDLRLHLKTTPQGLSGQFEYSRDLFDSERIARMADHFRTLLRAVARDPLQRLAALPLLSQEELRKVLVEWNATEKVYPHDTTLAGLFEAQVQRSPDAIALVDGTDRFTYAELDARANQVAHQLRSLNVGPGALVGICMKRSWRMLAGIIGILKAGGAYVPLDPTYPKDRLAFILEDTKAPVLLTEKALKTLRVSEQTRIVCLDSDWPEIQLDGSGNSLGAGAESSDLAYVIYTSGSTGKPKGVAIENRNAAALIYWARDVFTGEELAGVLASTSICFDLSIFEMFVPLSWGGTIILAENALALPGLQAAQEVTLINTVPSAMRELLRVKGVPTNVRVVNLAGEPLLTPLVNQIYSETNVQKVYDLYGPSETTTYSTFILRKPDAPATIGCPLANEQVYLLDRNLQPVPIGVPGEIYIGGDGVARGYLNRPELTAEKFISNSQAGPGKSCRIYKTGDLARWRADGNLEFLGRIDNQVKIRGFRIELGEIEAALRKHGALRDCIVIVREDRPDDKRLVAYVVSKPGAQPDADELRAFARAALPEYMVPGAMMFLDELPLTPNGKVDRKALPAPEEDRSGASAEFIEPVSKLEQELAAIWCEVLGINRIGTNDNFFELGGHSLLAIQVISRVREKLKMELPLSSLFDAPTIQQQARALESGKGTQDESAVSPVERAPRNGPLPSSSVQERLWFLDQVSPGGHAYNLPLALRLKGVLDASALQRALSEIVKRHESLRTAFVNSDDQLAQTINPQLLLAIEVNDLTAVPEVERESSLQAWLNSEAQRPFDLARGPLLRVKLGRLGASDHALSVVMHHAISDGWSQAIFFQELEALYTAFAAHEAAPQIPELRIQYADFAHWQRQWMRSAQLERQIGYWKGKLSGAPGSVNLPLDCAQLEDEVPESSKAGRMIEGFSSATAEALAGFCRNGNVTPFMVLMAALAIALEKLTRQQDMVIGTVVAGRTRRELESVIGCFMNFLPLRMQLDDEETALSFLAKVKATILEAQRHQECPFEKIVEAVNPERRSNQNPLYNVALLLQNFPEQLFKHKDLQVTPMRPDLEAAQLDMRFEAEFSGRNLNLLCEYRSNLFNAKTIQELLASYRAVLEMLLKNPSTKLAEFEITDQLRTQARPSRAPEPDLTIAIAATFTAEPVEESLKFWMGRLELPATIEFAAFNQVFQELLDPASVLAKNRRGVNVLLIRLEDLVKGAQTETLERVTREFVAAVKSASARMTIPLLIVLCPAAPNWGATFADIEKRIAGELETLDGVYVVTADELQEIYPVTDFYDARGDELGRVPYTPMFFTAMGTMIARRFHALHRAAHKVVVLDCDQTLWSGVCGEDGPRGICLDAPRRALQEFMRAQHAAGRLLAVCSRNNEEDVREVFVQRLDMPLRREHFAAWRLNWGPKSENIKSIAQELNLSLDSFIFVDDNPVECAEVQANCPDVLTLQLPENATDIPQFLKHCWAFDILKVTADDARRGEMYRENRQREELRADAGSLADFLAGLELKIEIAPMTSEQLPRVAQLTQRTNQFNLTTIRCTEPEIRQAAASADILTVSVSDRFGEYGLVGLMICEPREQALDVETFLLSCRVLGRGVEYKMLANLGTLACAQKHRWVNVHFHPSAKNKPALDFLQSVGAQFKQALNGGFVYAFPAEYAAEVVLNPQDAGDATSSGAPGIFDNRSLLTPEYSKFHICRVIARELNEATKIHQAIEQNAQVGHGPQSSYVAPRTEAEKQICELWQKLLRIDRVGAKDNFFELGGHSLLAVRLFAELEKLTGHKLPLVTIFQAPAVEELARAAAPSQAVPSRSVLVPVQSKGSRPPLFLVHGAGGDVLWGYANLAKHMHPDQPVYGIKSRGQVGLEEFHQIEEMARYYLEEVRALQPHGPYFFGGYCLGGNVAYEMARQLHTRGEQVAQLLLIDTTPSNAGYERILWWSPSFYYHFVRNLFYWFQDFFTLLRPADQRRYVVRKARVLGHKLARIFRRDRVAEDVDLDEVIDVSHFPESELKFWQIHLNALVAHVERPYPGAITLLRTRGQAAICSFDEDFSWGKLARGGVSVKYIPGSHENIFVEPNVKHLGHTIEECLLAHHVSPKT